MTLESTNFVSGACEDGYHLRPGALLFLYKSLVNPLCLRCYPRVGSARACCDYLVSAVGIGRCQGGLLSDTLPASDLQVPCVTVRPESGLE